MAQEAAATARRDPGPLVWVHRLLIVVALCAAVAYAAFELRGWLDGGGAGAGLRAGAAAAAAVAITAYLRSLRGLAVKLGGAAVEPAERS